MQPCPDPHCQYQTTNSKNLQKHIAKTKHGQATSTKKQFRGHLTTPKKRKSKNS